MAQNLINKLLSIMNGLTEAEKKILEPFLNSKTEAELMKINDKDFLIELFNNVSSDDIQKLPKALLNEINNERLKDNTLLKEVADMFFFGNNVNIINFAAFGRILLEVLGVKISDDMGIDKMQQELNKLLYTNSNISDEKLVKGIMGLKLMDLSLVPANMIAKILQSPAYKKEKASDKKDFMEKVSKLLGLNNLLDKDPEDIVLNKNNLEVIIENSGYKENEKKDMLDSIEKTTMLFTADVKLGKPTVYQNIWSSKQDKIYQMRVSDMNLYGKERGAAIADAREASIKLGKTSKEKKAIETFYLNAHDKSRLAVLEAFGKDKEDYKDIFLADTITTTDGKMPNPIPGALATFGISSGTSLGLGIISGLPVIGDFIGPILGGAALVSSAGSVINETKKALKTAKEQGRSLTIQEKINIGINAGSAVLPYAVMLAGGSWGRGIGAAIMGTKTFLADIKKRKAVLGTDKLSATDVLKSVGNAALKAGAMMAGGFLGSELSGVINNTPNISTSIETHSEDGLINQNSGNVNKDDLARLQNHEFDLTDNARDTANPDNDRMYKLDPATGEYTQQDWYTKEQYDNAISSLKQAGVKDADGALRVLAGAGMFEGGEFTEELNELLSGGEVDQDTINSIFKADEILDKTADLESKKSEFKKVETQTIIKEGYNISSSEPEILKSTATQEILADNYSEGTQDATVTLPESQNVIANDYTEKTADTNNINNFESQEIIAEEYADDTTNEIIKVSSDSQRIIADGLNTDTSKLSEVNTNLISTNNLMAEQYSEPVELKNVAVRPNSLDILNNYEENGTKIDYSADVESLESEDYKKTSISTDTQSIFADQFSNEEIISNENNVSIQENKEVLETVKTLNQAFEGDEKLTHDEALKRVVEDNNINKTISRELNNLAKLYVDEGKTMFTENAEALDLEQALDKRIDDKIVESNADNFKIREAINKIEKLDPSNKDAMLNILNDINQNFYSNNPDKQDILEGLSKSIEGKEKAIIELSELKNAIDNTSDAYKDSNQSLSLRETVNNTVENIQDQELKQKIKNIDKIYNEKHGAIYLDNFETNNYEKALEETISEHINGDPAPIEYKAPIKSEAEQLLNTTDLIKDAFSETDNLTKNEAFGKIIDSHPTGHFNTNNKNIIDLYNNDGTVLYTEDGKALSSDEALIKSIDEGIQENLNTSMKLEEALDQVKTLDPDNKDEIYKILNDVDLGYYAYNNIEKENIIATLEAYIRGRNYSNIELTDLKDTIIDIAEAYQNNKKLTSDELIQKIASNVEDQTLRIKMANLEKIYNTDSGTLYTENAANPLSYEDAAEAIIDKHIESLPKETANVTINESELDLKEMMNNISEGSYQFDDSNSMQGFQDFQKAMNKSVEDIGREM